jgi:hypothetical protein
VNDRVALSPEAIVKSQLCRKVFSDLGVSLENALEVYAVRPFYDSGLTKSSFFLQVLTGQVDRRLATIVADRCDLPYLKDRRSALDYGVNLVLGWLVEDAVAEWLRQAGATVSVSGSDANREFLGRAQVSQDADLSVAVDGSQRALEVLCDWQDTWRLRDHLDLRDNKYRNLRSEQALIFGLAPMQDSGLVIDLAQEGSSFRRNPSIRGYGGKPGFTLDGVGRLLRSSREALLGVKEVICVKAGAQDDA